MRKINRYDNFFQYDREDPDFRIPAFNEGNKKIQLQIRELDKEQYDIYIMFVSHVPSASRYLYYTDRQGRDSLLEFSISKFKDGVHEGSVYGLRRKNNQPIAPTDNVFKSLRTPVIFNNTFIAPPGGGAPPADYELKELSFISFDCQSGQDFTKVRMERAGLETTEDEEFWEAIKTNQLSFRPYLKFINSILYKPTPEYSGSAKKTIDNLRGLDKRRGAFVGVNEYQMLKYGTEFYMLKHSALDENDVPNYMPDRLPYFEHLSDVFEQQEQEYLPETSESAELKKHRFKTPFFIELIWNYWMEQGMLMQTMNLINLRFQNISVGNAAGNQLTRFDLSPLRPLSHMLWGFIQDEQHRLSLARRIQEYDHEYGLTLAGRSAPAFTPADSRSKFLEAFHNLLTTTSIYYKESDDTTRIADAFPVLNSLKEVHLLLAEGNHNAYGNLTWTARHEMLMTQYIIARDETRVFLGGRPMVPYPEDWMDRVDTVRNMMGWGSTSITYFYDLAIHGEKLLLSIRYGDWSDANMPAANAANWALAFRDSVQKYMHAYRTVTSADLSADAAGSNSAIRAIQPSALIQRRVLEERSRQQRRA